MWKVHFTSEMLSGSFQFVKLFKIDEIITPSCFDAFYVYGFSNFTRKVRLQFKIDSISICFIYNRSKFPKQDLTSVPISLSKDVDFLTKQRWQAYWSLEIQSIYFEMSNTSCINYHLNRYILRHWDFARQMWKNRNWMNSDEFLDWPSKTGRN